MKPEDPFPRRVLLVGFMGSGKSTVGPLLSEALGWTFRDFDRAVEARTGRWVSEIFRDQGEAAFREAEHDAAQALLSLDGAVLAAGGGWPCRPGRMDGLPPGTLTIWLRVTAATAVARASRDGTVRPLLEAPDPLARAQELLDARAPYYRMAAWSIDSEAAPPGELARRLAEKIESDPGGSLRE